MQTQEPQALGTQLRGLNTVVSSMDEAGTIRNCYKKSRKLMLAPRVELALTVKIYSISFTFVNMPTTVSIMIYSYSNIVSGHSKIKFLGLKDSSSFHLLYLLRRDYHQSIVLDKQHYCRVLSVCLIFL